MKSPIDLLQLLLTECGKRCDVSTQRDFERIHVRFETEGFSFLAITLANFGKDFERSLDRGFVAPDLFRSFTKRAGLPELFRGFLEKVFEPGSGVLRPSPCLDSVRSIRQLCLMWAKKKEQCTPEREYAAFKQFERCESDVQVNSVRFAGWAQRGDPDYLDFRRMSRLLFAPGFSIIDRKIFEGDVKPGHGPGAVAERTSSNGKYVPTTWTDRLEGIFPSGKFLFPGYRFLAGSELAHLDPGNETPVRVVSVPKTVTTPRIIAIEPVCMQYMQQAIKREFDELWDRPSISGRTNFPHFFINTRSQVPNQDLAREGSITGALATLDLSEASDRVANRLVHWLVMDHPHLGEAIQATRSRHADVPHIGVLRLSKFASMGSALTFPVEAMVFLTVVFIGIERELGRHLTSKDIESFIGKVRVYGDDIIVPVDCVDSVYRSLELYGFKVNEHKSFWNGKFRESCGKEYFDGTDVTLVRLRRDIPTDRRQTDSLVSFSEFRNQLYLAGYWGTVKVIDKWIEDVIPYPSIALGSEGIGKVSFLGYQADRICPNLQRPMVKAAVPDYVKRSDPLDGVGALMKFFISKMRSDDPIFSKEHLQFAGRPSAVRTKLKWVYSDYGVDVA